MHSMVDDPYPIDAGKHWLGIRDFLDSDPPKHDRIRQVLKNAFTPRKIGEVEGKIRAQVDELLDPLIERGSGEFVEEVGDRLPLAIVFDLLGYPREDSPELLELVYQAQAPAPGETEVPQLAVYARTALELYIEDAAKQSRQRPHDDLLSMIVEGEKTGQVLPEEVTGICLLLMLARWETTSILTANAMWLLSGHPEQKELLVREPERIPAAIEEMLRFESPAVQHHE